MVVPAFALAYPSAMMLNPVKASLIDTGALTTFSQLNDAPPPEVNEAVIGASTIV